MTFILALDPASFPQGIVRVFHEFAKSATIPAVESKLYLHANLFGVINILGVLQDDRLKNGHPLAVPLPISYTIELH